MKKLFCILLTLLISLSCGTAVRANDAPQENVLALHGEGLKIYADDPLLVQSCLPDAAAKSLSAMLSGSTAVFESAEEILTSMQSEQAFDLYFLNNAEDYAKYSASGQLALLSSNAALSALTERFYPFIQKQALHEGQFLFFPYAVKYACGQLCADPSALSVLQRSEQDLPRDIPSLLALIQELDREDIAKTYLLSRHEDIAAFQGELIRALLMHRYAAQLSQNEPLQFDTPELNEQVDRIVNLKLNHLQCSSDPGTAKKPLFTASALPLRPAQLRPLPLFGKNPSPFQVQCAVVNASSANIDKALDFLAAFAANMRLDKQFLLFQDIGFAEPESGEGNNEAVSGVLVLADSEEFAAYADYLSGSSSALALNMGLEGLRNTDFLNRLHDLLHGDIPIKDFLDYCRMYVEGKQPDAVHRQK